MIEFPVPKRKTPLYREAEFDEPAAYFATFAMAFLPSLILCLGLGTLIPAAVFFTVLILVWMSMGISKLRSGPTLSALEHRRMARFNSLPADVQQQFPRYEEIVMGNYDNSDSLHDKIKKLADDNYRVQTMAQREREERERQTALDEAKRTQDERRELVEEYSGTASRYLEESKQLDHMK